MIDWLKQHIRAGVNKVEDLANRAYDGLVALWNVFTNFLHMMRVVFADLAFWVFHWVKNVELFAEWVAKMLRWAVVVAIPRAIRTAVNYAHTLASQLFANAEKLWNRAVAGVESLARDLVNTARRWAKSLIDWVYARVTIGLDWINRLGNRIADIVLHPDKLVAWILPALWGPLWRFIEARGVAIGRWVLRKSLVTVVSGAGMIESWLAKIL
jgi:hypothetical protein